MILFLQHACPMHNWREIIFAWLLGWLLADGRKIKDVFKGRNIMVVVRRLI
jgi:hypothetical protein